MRKQNEIDHDNSCFNRALPGEMIFVLLGRDASAPAAIRFWATERVARGLNLSDDAQIIEANACASVMQREHGDLHAKLLLAKAEAEARAAADKELQHLEPNIVIDRSLRFENGEATITIRAKLLPR